MPPHRKSNRKSYAGFYMANHFLITMYPEYPFFLEQNVSQEIDLNGQYFPIYAHEYWHFLQNATTLSGFKSFAFSQHLLPFLSKAAVVNADGTVHGDAALTDEDRSNFTALVEAHRSLEGEPGPAGTEDDLNVGFQVLGAQRVNRSTLLRGAVVPLSEVCLEVVVDIQDDLRGPSRTDKFLLGALAIEESVAFAVEEAVAKHLRKPVEPVPAFPYRVVERLFQYYVGTSEPAAARAAIGTLALMTTHPGPALIDLLTTYGAAIRAGCSPHVALDEARKSIMGDIRGPIYTVLTHDLKEIEKMHAGRGLMDRAARWVCGIFAKSLKRRLSDPLFDLMAVFPRFHGPSFRALHGEYFCDALQKRSPLARSVDTIQGDEELMLDLLVSFTEWRDELGNTPSDYVRTLQAQQHYLAEHVDWDNLTIKPSGGARQTCPYYTSCPLGLRRERPEVCAMMPWAHFDASSEVCWYGSSVASVLGPVKIRKRKDGV